jgi:hypothetical protein
MVAADQQAELYLLPERFGRPGAGEILFPEVFGCAFSRGRSYSLGQLAGKLASAGIGHEALAGSVVAYQYFAVDQVSETWNVLVRNLATGTLKRVPTGTPSGPSAKGPGVKRVGVGPVRGLVARSDGRVAWIAVGEPADGPFQVHVLDGSGSRLVASGPDISPTSLALGGTQVYWTQGEKPYSASLR